MRPVTAGERQAGADLSLYQKKEKARIVTFLLPFLPPPRQLPRVVGGRSQMLGSASGSLLGLAMKGQL